MNTTVIRSLASVALLLLAVQFHAGASDHFAKGDALQPFLDNRFASANAGMVIGLVDERGSRIYSAGKLDNGTDARVDGDTVFEIGSVTKVFTSLLALDMARRGEVSLDDPVAKHLPPPARVPVYEGKEITLRHLAAQESGLPWHPDTIEKILDWGSGKPNLKEFKAACDAYTAEDLFAFLARHELTEAPGTRFQYSNVGMSLLGHAMALRAGGSYESLLVERIARPLRMESTGITVTPEMKPRLARGHWADGTPSENVRFQVTAPAGAMVSTANDLLKFLSANLGLTPTELAAPMREMQIVRHTGDAKFGKTATPWFDEGVYQPPGSELLAHGGGGVGYLAFVGFDKQKRRGVVVLTNQMAMSPYGVGWTILQGMPLSRENVAFYVREIVGIGMVLDEDKDTGLLRIRSVYPRSPAGQAGLTAGLLVHSINGASVEGKTIKECLAMMGGAEGTKVKFKISDAEKSEARTVELTREKFLTASG